MVQLLTGLANIYLCHMGPCRPPLPIVVVGYSPSSSPVSAIGYDADETGPNLQWSKDPLDELRFMSDVRDDHCGFGCDWLDQRQS